MRIIVDRIEGELATVELDGEMLTVPRALIADAGEGDALEITVVGRAALTEDDETPHDVFERLRRKHRARKS